MKRNLKFIFIFSILVLFYSEIILAQKKDKRNLPGQLTNKKPSDSTLKSDKLNHIIKTDTIPIPLTDSNSVIKTTDAMVQTPPVVDSALLDRITELEQQVSEQKSGDDHFMVVGLATLGFISSKGTNTLNGASSVIKTNSFPDAGRFEFSPLFLWRHGKKFLMEFEPSFNNGGLSVNWADISYFATPGLIIRAGYLVLPFGYYNKHLAAGWIGKLASDPIGIGTPASDYGIEVEGGLPLGNMKWNYDFAITNGLQLLNDGQIQNAGITDNNKNKTLSGRLGILPFSNSSLELGFSSLYGKIGDAVTKFKNASTTMYALDINFVKAVNPIMINFKAQYNLININRQNFVNPNDSTQNYSFDNKTNSSYTQLSLRPSFSKNEILKNFELAFRYANYTTPENSLFGNKSNQFNAGICYWVNWRSVLKLTHETLSETSTINKVVGTDTGKTVTNSWILQFSIQL